jgi:hypothetical protein
MSGSVKQVAPFLSTTGPNCFAADLSPNAGVVVRVVVVSGAGQCRDIAHGDLGVVFFGMNPVMWTCLSSADIERFKTWARSNFSAEPMDVAANLGGVNCPPPDATEPQMDAATAEMRNMLTELGSTWLADAAKPSRTKPAA